MADTNFVLEAIKAVVAGSPGRGQGLFAARTISKDEIILSNHVLLISAADYRKIVGTDIARYPFKWSLADEQRAYALALGDISFCNHSVQATCRFCLDQKHLKILLMANRDISAGEELTVHYDYDEPYPFNVVER